MGAAADAAHLLHDFCPVVEIRKDVDSGGGDELRLRRAFCGQHHTMLLAALEAVPAVPHLPDDCFLQQRVLSQYCSLGAL